MMERKNKGMNNLDQTLLEGRFDLRKTQYLSERFEKSPNITEQSFTSDHLHISYAVQDTSVLPLVRESFFRACMYVKDWFCYQGDIAFALWMAPELVDMQYMTCFPCDEGLTGAAKVIYESKRETSSKTFEALDWLAQLTNHIPNRGEQMEILITFWR